MENTFALDTLRKSLRQAKPGQAAPAGIDLAEMVLTNEHDPMALWWVMFLEIGPLTRMASATDTLLAWAQAQNIDTTQATLRKQWWAIENVLSQGREKGANVAQLARDILHHLAACPQGLASQDDEGRLLWLRAVAVEPTLAGELHKHGFAMGDKGQDGCGVWDVLLDRRAPNPGNETFVDVLLKHAPFSIRKGQPPVLHTLPTTAWADNIPQAPFVLELFKKTAHAHPEAWVGGHLEQRRLGFWLIETASPLQQLGVCLLLNMEMIELCDELKAGCQLANAVLGHDKGTLSLPALDDYCVGRFSKALDRLPNAQRARSMLDALAISQQTQASPTLVRTARL